MKRDMVSGVDVWVCVCVHIDIVFFLNKKEQQGRIQRQI